MASTVKMDEVKRVLRENFRLDEFRANQEEVISRLLLDNESACAIMPTGSGKSLCYQLPALLFPGLTLVISPLLALMRDQVDSLVRRGIKAGRFDSHQTNEEYLEVMGQLRSGELKLLYVAPERLNMEGFISTIREYDLDLVAVDESHCVSQWGDAFRPDYLKIARFVEENGAKRVLCLTATATSNVATDICRKFKIDEIDGLFRTSSYRENLHLTVRSVPWDPDGSDRINMAAEFCRLHVGPTIIYITTQANSSNVALALEAKGIKTRAYHAGLDPAERKSVQDWFMGSSTAVVCATIAFGMGIDKSNIRNIIHFNLPKSLEGYSQEIGRAGRDGRPSNCVMYLMSGDRAILENFARGNTPSQQSVRRLVRSVCIAAKVQGLKKNGVLITNNSELSRDFDIRDVTLGLLFAQLELHFGLIRATTPMYAVFDYKVPGNASLYQNAFNDDSKEGRAIRDFSRFGKTWFSVDIMSAAEPRKISRDSLVAKLNEWSNHGWIELKPSQRRNRYFILKDLPEDEEEMDRIADEMFGRMETLEQAEVLRMEGVFSWAADATCLAKSLAIYFDDLDSFPGDDDVCGRCTVCNSGGDPAVVYDDKPLAFDEGLFRNVLNATNIRDDARFLARVAFGITSPRITAEKLSKHEVFGTMSQHRWDDVLARCQKVVDEYAAMYPDGPPASAHQPTSKAPAKRKFNSSAGTSQPPKKPYAGGGSQNKKPFFRRY